VIDENCRIPSGMVIGEDQGHDAERFHVTPEGVVLVVPEMLARVASHAR
jgi:glucose-1-phosphate adenylyltransferase